MSKKLKNERSCIVCRSRKLKNEMLRIVRYNDDIKLDYSNKSDGRGVYICKSKECIEKAISKKALNRAFKTNVAQKVYDELSEVAFD